MDGLIGKTIGRYRIVEHLGRGGMAEVYKAYQASLDRYVAIKLMHTFLADEKEFLTRFEREAKVVATLRHPNIVQMLDFDVDNGVYYMVMEFISGETLKARMQALESKGEWVSPDDAARIILAVGSALKYAHERGMVHRDVKPANVMITTEGQVILTDFGIAKIVSASNLTASGAMVGTPSYMAPEQGMGQPGDERSDIYSLGVMLYQLEIGRLPYDADTPLAVVLKHINEPLPLPKVLKPDLSDELNRIILKALAKNPADRYQKVGELMIDLRKAMGMPIDESQADSTAQGSAIQLSGATVVGRVGGLTPLPRITATHATATQLSGLPAVGAAPTQIGSAPIVAPQPQAQKKRPIWIIPMILLALIAVGAVVVMALSGGAIAPTSIPTIALTSTVGPTSTPTLAPIASLVMTLKRDNVELHDKPDTNSTVLGLLNKATQFFLKARTSDSKWLRIETVDGVAAGWVVADAVDLSAVSPDQLKLLPLGTTLTQPTNTPTLTLEPTDTLTPTLTLAPTNTPAPTKTPGPTKPPVTPKPTVPPVPTAVPTSAVVQPLNYGFSFDLCTYDGGNYTCNITVWASGGTGNYWFAMENPDTGNWDQRGPVGRTTYLMRSRRCKTKIQQLRLWDDANPPDHMEPNITMDPGAIASLFPGGACTP